MLHAFFRGDKIWVTKHFLKKAELYQNSIKQEKILHLLGHGRIEHGLSEGTSIQDIKHCEVVMQMGSLLIGSLTMFVFLGKRGVVEFKVILERDSVSQRDQLSLELLELFISKDQYIQDHYQSTSGFTSTSTSSDIRNELAESLT